MSETPGSRFFDAYIQMAKKAKYRPEAPNEGMGSVELIEEELKDQDRLRQEAVAYAKRFLEEQDSCSFRIGVSNYDTNRAFVYAIEAARLLCGGHSAAPIALKLLEMAATDVQASLTHARASS